MEMAAVLPGTVRGWLQLRFDFDSTVTCPPFDSHSTARRPLDDLGYTQCCEVIEIQVTEIHI